MSGLYEVQVIKSDFLTRKLFTKVLSKTALRVGFVFILSYTSRKLTKNHPAGGICYTFI